MIGRIKDTSEPVYKVTLPGVAPIWNAGVSIRRIGPGQDFFIDLPSSRDGTYSLSEAARILHSVGDQAGVALPSDEDLYAKLAEGETVRAADFGRMLKDTLDESRQLHTFPIGANVAPPAPIKNPDPARPRGHPSDTTSTLLVFVSDAGEVSRIDVISGPEDAAAEAREAIQQWRYKPAQLNGRAVEGMHIVEWQKGVAQQLSVPAQAARFLIYAR
jgi:hypothetical protein